MRTSRFDTKERPDRGRRILAVIAVALGAALTAAVAWSEPPSEREQHSDETRRPAAESAEGIRFAHRAHSDLNCSHCHGGEQGSANEMSFDMETCAECHGAGADGKSSDAARPRLRSCKGCHVGYDRSVDEPIESAEDWRAVEPPPMIPPRPTGDPSFDHRQHVRDVGRHASESENHPEREVCAECHGEGEPSVPGAAACRECHGDDSPAPMKPGNHTVDWRRRHDEVARSGPGECRECHTEDDCAGCHDSQSAEPFSVHPPNFDTLHAADARANLDNCTECHTVDTFCRRCHAETKFAAEPPDRPPARYDAHPPSWTDPEAPNNHATMARRNISDCASCHTERDCVTCHQGIDPHPPDFQLRCKRQLKANPAPCAKCHGDLADLRGKCL